MLDGIADHGAAALAVFPAGGVVFLVKRVAQVEAMVWEVFLFLKA
jgi:hypothetical protein